MKINFVNISRKCETIFFHANPIADLEQLPAQMLPRVAEHGHAQIVVQAQQDVRKHPPVRTTWIRALMYVPYNTGVRTEKLKIQVVFDMMGCTVHSCKYNGV